MRPKEEPREDGTKEDKRPVPDRSDTYSPVPSSPECSAGGPWVSSGRGSMESIRPTAWRLQARPLNFNPEYLCS